MSLFAFNDEEALGVVRAVDTATVLVGVDNVDLLRKLQVNRLAVLQSSKPGQYLIGVVQKITRDIATAKELAEAPEDAPSPEEKNTVKVTLIGTFIEKEGTQSNVFRRTLETVPEIDANCFPIEGDRLTRFMRVISHQGKEDMPRLSLGSYTLDENAEAYLNANRFFQRHAVIVGSTGSGKSWTTARLLEQIAALPNANAVLFDIHGEYSTLEGDGFRHYRIAGPGDLEADTGLENGVLFLPYWLLAYEEMVSMLVDRTDQNAPNQSMLISRSVVSGKQKYLQDGKHEDILANFTVDSPVPYALDEVQNELTALNDEMVEGARGQKQGDYFGKLSRLIARLENKRKDRRLGFMFQAPKETMEFAWLERFAKSLMAGTRDQADGKGGVKIIDFSEVPSDVLPLVVGRIASLIFFVAQWTERDHRHPIAILCDEAHLYIPERIQAGGAGESSLNNFERIAKEGRKYGVGLVVISQRPSEVNRTVLSQCNNFVALRLTNAEDQSVVQRLLPDNLGGLAGLLPVLDTGEALVVGDASLLPSRIRISKPTSRPDSGTIDFWDKWATDEPTEQIASAVMSWRRQSSAGKIVTKTQSSSAEEPATKKKRGGTKE
jgi:DNA helicase HerA-like ATPase